MLFQQSLGIAASSSQQEIENEHNNIVCVLGVVALVGLMGAAAAVGSFTGSGSTGTGTMGGNGHMNGQMGAQCQNGQASNGMMGSQGHMGMMNGTGLNCQNLSGTQCNMTQNSEGTCNCAGYQNSQALALCRA